MRDFEECDTCQYWVDDECVNVYHDDCVRREGICWTPKEDSDDHSRNH